MTERDGALQTLPAPAIPDLTLPQFVLRSALDRPNKGLEGLTCVRRGGHAYLLGLCEGNRCKGGAEAASPLLNRETQRPRRSR
jgi:hypothetical protein